MVTGQCKDGTQVPLLISSSQISVAGQILYVLLFEQLKKKCAILVVDESGVISSGTENLNMVIGWQTARVRRKKGNAGDSQDFIFFSSASRKGSEHCGYCSSASKVSERI